ncbi:MAG: hypothetical protein ACREBC_35420, partial [Pyrinomonadaceae bacterium]
TMYSYWAYDLRIISDLQLPELIGSAELRPDVTIKFGTVEHKPEAVDYEGTFRYHINGAEAYFFWDKVASFRVRDGNEVTIELRSGVEEELVRLLLLGAVFSVLLYQRGLLALHASAIAINDCAVAFMGGKGWGKSTLAATLHARGHYLLADDLVALKFDDRENPLVLSGFPQIKLWPDAIASLGEDPETLPRVASRYDKRARRSTERFSQRRFPLKGIYVLAEGAIPECIPTQPQEAITQLIANSHIARFGKQVLKGIDASLHLHQCVDLARAVPVYRLKRPLDLSHVASVAKIVEQQFGYGIEPTEIESLSLLPSA